MASQTGPCTLGMREPNEGAEMKVTGALKLDPQSPNCLPTFRIAVLYLTARVTFNSPHWQWSSTAMIRSSYGGAFPQRSFAWTTKRRFTRLTRVFRHHPSAAAALVNDESA